MHKELFSIFENGEPETDETEKSEEFTDALIDLSKRLDGDDIAFIVSEWMKNHNEHLFVARSYNESTGNKLLHFRMEAEFGYYLDDLEDGDNE